METEQGIIRRTLRLPQDAANRVQKWSKKNCTSENAEIVRCIRERMEREQAADAA